jgi:hypothetical protein
VKITEQRSPQFRGGPTRSVPWKEGPPWLASPPPAATSWLLGGGRSEAGTRAWEELGADGRRLRRSAGRGGVAGDKVAAEGMPARGG